MIKNRAFTLLELIVVIVILGILATLGYTQYGKMMEKFYMAETRTIFGRMRKDAYEYFWKNGSMNGMVSADVGIGSDIPASCVSTNYFYYYIYNPSGNQVQLAAVRCTSGGKPPQASCLYAPYIYANPVNGDGQYTIYNPNGCNVSP
ncbi:MAG: type II secretion system protein [Candidatus Omnitrophica bacterium]|nr:type II secretion system protein [Candidatus Omnitrophota bacterium]